MVYKGYSKKILNIYMLFTGREVRIGRNCEVLSTAQTEGTVSPNTDRPRPVNTIVFW